MAKAARLGAVAVVLALGATLAGCSAQQPGSAAVVDGSRIPTSELQQTMTELSPFFQNVSNSAVLSVLIQEPTLSAVAAEHGKGVSDQQAQDYLTQAVAQNGGKGDETFSQGSLAVARYSLAYQAIQDLATDDASVNDEVAKKLDALDVKVNPRFGTIADHGQVDDPKPWPWLTTATESTPTPTSTPSK
ncbi:hypothetical protein [Cellulomonas sp. HZM]|uniref:hypothetical protein n=1 Tax=Cellulomonas sp. HZM TaxID=1454010 RepID=UPI000551D570|nr:hypothetical protein [Cellulomonas sp. HZM]